MGPTALTLQSINRGDRAECPMLAKGNPDSKLAVDGPKELDGLILFTVLGGRGAFWMTQEGCKLAAILERGKKKNTFGGEALQGRPQSGTALADFTAPVKGRALGNM